MALDLKDGLTLRNAIAIAVVSVWIITAMASVVTNNYTSLGAVTPVMLIVATFLFRPETKKNGGN
jgi:hypothetical protein